MTSSPSSCSPPTTPLEDVNNERHDPLGVFLRDLLVTKLSPPGAGAAAAATAVLSASAMEVVSDNAAGSSERQRRLLREERRKRMRKQQRQQREKQKQQQQQLQLRREQDEKRRRNQRQKLQRKEEHQQRRSENSCDDSSSDNRRRRSTCASSSKGDVVLQKQQPLLPCQHAPDNCIFACSSPSDAPLPPLVKNLGDYDDFDQVAVLKKRIEQRHSRIAKMLLSCRFVSGGEHTGTAKSPPKLDSYLHAKETDKDCHEWSGSERSSSLFAMYAQTRTSSSESVGSTGTSSTASISSLSSTGASCNDSISSGAMSNPSWDPPQQARPRCRQGDRSIEGGNPKSRPSRRKSCTSGSSSESKDRSNGIGSDRDRRRGRRSNESRRYSAVV